MTSSTIMNPSYSCLPSPFRSLGQFKEADQETLLKEESEYIDGTSFRRIGRLPYQRGIQVLRVGTLDLIAGRTTPAQGSNSSPAFSCFFAMPVAGGFVTRDGSLRDEVAAGDIYLNQSHYGENTMGYLSSLFVALDKQQLDRTMHSISGGESLASLGTSIVIRGKSRPTRAIGPSKLWALIDLIDRLNEDDATIPSCLGLEDQFYRLLSLALLETCGRLEKAKAHWEASARNWRNPLDELVDYIRANAHLNLTLTDLEQQCHYSARHLQNLFRQKFDCTPMQFVRQQRLSNAMEKLQTAEHEDTVTSISRACGYRFITNFSNDFRRQFGVSPSTVLRASRRRC